MRRLAARIAALLLLAAAVHLGVADERASVPRKPASAAESGPRFQSTGIVFGTGAPGGAWTQIRIERLEARERKLGWLTLRDVLELRLEGLRAQIRLAAPKADPLGSAAEPPVESAAEPLAHVLELAESLPIEGSIVGLRIRGLRVEWSDGSHHAGLTLTSGSAELRAGSEGLRLAGGVELVSGRGTWLRADRATWRDQERVLVVPAGSAWGRSQGVANVSRGERIQLRPDELDFDPAS